MDLFGNDYNDDWFTQNAPTPPAVVAAPTGGESTSFVNTAPPQTGVPQIPAGQTVIPNYYQDYYGKNPANRIADADAFGRDWLASGGRTPADLKKFLADHPQYSATIGGSKGDKVTIGGRTFDAVLSAGAGGLGASWNDISNGGGGSGAGPAGGLFTTPYTGVAPTLPSTPTYTAPVFNAPTFSTPPAFAAPSIQDAQNEPGYQFAVGQGRQALEQSAAAHGLLNSGGTLRDLVDYGQKAGAQQYQGVYNRKLGAYQTNVNTQFLQPYQFQYQAAMDSFTPKLAEFNANVGAGNMGYTTTVNSDWQKYLQDYNVWRNQKNDYVSAFNVYNQQ